MRYQSLLLMVLMVAAVPGAAPAQQPESGTIAVLPFGVAVQNQGYQETAVLLAQMLESVLLESQRFSNVLPRSADEAIKQELLRTTEEWTLNSVVQIAQDAQLNATYVTYGWITSQAFNSERLCARISVTLKVVDVLTGSLVLNDHLELDNTVGPRVAQWCAEQSEATAYDAARKRAPDKLRDMLHQSFGYTLLDVIEEDGVVQVVLLAPNGNPGKGTELHALVSRTGVGDRVYQRELGELRVTSLEGDIATAEFKDPRKAASFVSAVNDGQSIIIRRK